MAVFAKKDWTEISPVSITLPYKRRVLTRVFQTMVCVADYYFGKYKRQQQNEQGKHKHPEKITRLEVFHNRLISVPCSNQFSMKLYQQMFYERSIMQSLWYAYQFSFILTLQLFTMTKISHLDSLWKTDCGELGNCLFTTENIGFETAMTSSLTDVTK